MTDDQQQQKPDEQEPVAATTEVSDEELKDVSGGNMTAKNPKSPFDDQP